MAFIRSGGFRVLLLATAVAAFLAGGVAAVLYLSLVRDLPDLTTIEDYRPPLSSRVVDRSGTPIGEFSSERRRLASIDAIPRHTQLAFVAAEDGGFFEHKGIDYTSILRAAIANLKAGGEIKQGASTITQQTVKSLLLSPERTFRRKFREMILARKIEQHLTKDEILYLYLNQIYFGAGAWGISEAAHTYFDKPVDELTISESALLAGLPQRPNSWQPFKNPQAAEKRRRYVLYRMLQDQMIEPEEYELALAEPPEVRSASDSEFFEASAHFTELVRRFLFDELGGDAVLSGGLVIETTLDAKLQQVAANAIKTGLHDLDHRSGYRGPVRQIASDAIPAELEILAEENDLVWEPPVAENGEDGEANADTTAGELAGAGATGATGAAGDALAAASDPNAAEDDPDAVVDGQPADPALLADPTLLADAAALAAAEAAEAELLLPPELPFETALLGVVTAVDSEAQTARVEFSPERAGEVRLADVEWAREPNPKRRPRPVKKISAVFSVGDVAHFERLEDWPEDDDAEEEVAADPDALPECEVGEDGLAVDAGIGEDGEASCIVPEVLARVTLHQVPEAQGSLLTMEVKTGDVLALIGGYDYATSQFNRATQALRQPGSAFKPFIYGAALAKGYTPVETLYDRPIVYEDPVSGFKYKPENYERRFFGPVPMRYALAHSINNATVHLFRDVGVDYVIDYARRLGIRSPLNRDLSLAIGSSSVTLLELTSAYGVFPNHGRRMIPRFINRVTDRDGQVLFERVELGAATSDDTDDADSAEDEASAVAIDVASPSPDLPVDDGAESEALADEGAEDADQIISEQIAYLMCDLLKAVVNEGTGRRLKSLNRPLAGKTGTTNDFADAWFMGFSPELVTGVWVGHDQAAVRLGWGESGARAALPIWQEVMVAALADRPARDFEVPSEIEFRRIDRETGLLADDNAKDIYFQPFLEGNVPTLSTGSASQSSQTQRALRSDAF